MNQNEGVHVGMKFCLSVFSILAMAAPALAWIPQGDNFRPVSEACEASNLDQVLSPKQSLKSWTGKLKERLRECDQSFNELQFDSVRSLIEFSRIEYDPKLTPGVKPVSFTLRDGRKLRGLLGLKPGKRPLIVARCGVYCDADKGSTASVLFPHLFEEGDFHVLMLGSSTGQQYAKDNHILNISGFDEGAQTFEVMEQISHDPRLVPRVQEFHLFGMSLGGHGNFYATLYASKNAARLARPIRSSLSMCPVVDLKEQLTVAFSNSPRGFFYGSLTRDLFASILNFVPLLGEVLSPRTTWARPELLKATLEVSLTYYRENFSRLGVAGFWPAGTKIDTAEAFDRINRFQNYARDLQIPTLALYSRDDLLVVPGINGKKLTPVLSNTLQSVELTQGSHCAFDLSVGWSTYGQILRSYYQSQSSLPREPMRQIPIPAEIRKSLKFENPWPDVKPVQARWSIRPGSPTAQLELVGFAGHIPSEQDGPLCSEIPSGQAPMRCYFANSATVPLSLFQVVGLPAQADSPRTAGRMARFLNSKVSLLDEQGDVVNGRNVSPTLFKIRGTY